MTWNTCTTVANEGDLVELVGLSHKHFIFELAADKDFHTHRGVLHHNDLIGLPWGSQVFSHNGAPFFMLQPSLSDILREIPRRTQIIYPKDMGYLLFTLGVGPGQKVVEAGTGSGALTSALAYLVGKEGHIYTYEQRPEFSEYAQKNLARVGLSERVTFKVRDIAEGFDETNADILFLDVPNPFDYIGSARRALKPGGMFASLLPTFNQVSKLLIVLRQHDFAFVDVCEIMLRFYKPEPDRLRPVDRMVAHTGYLIFARPVVFDRTRTETKFLVETGLESEGLIRQEKRAEKDIADSIDSETD